MKILPKLPAPSTSTEKSTECFSFLLCFSLYSSLPQSIPSGRMERVYGQIVDTMVGTVVQNWLSFSTSEISRLWNINDDFQNLKQLHLMIRCILEDEERNPETEKSVQLLLTKLEALAFDADYLFDQLNYHRLRSEMDEKVSLLNSTFDPISFGRRIAKEITEIEKRSKLLNEEAKGLGLWKRKRIPGFRDGIDTLAYLETDSFFEDPVFIGRESDVEKIVKLVENPTEEVVFVLPIVGMPGSGKTSLIRRVYNDPNIKSMFKKRIWLHVSQDSFDPLDVFKSIAASSTGKSVHGSRQFVLQKLQRSLGNKKYLLVLDCVWNEDNNKWENFMSSLRGISSCKGNVILLTTQNRNVANIVKTLDIHELGLLSEHDCWVIIKAKAFGVKDVRPVFETVGKNIAIRCGGLPLAADVVGSMLRGKSEHEWVSMEKNWISSSRGNVNIISKIMNLSIDHLAAPLHKKCFALFSIVPKGWQMEKNVLIKLWKAEGLLQTGEEIDMDLVGNEVFNILEQSCLLQVVKESNGEYCKMHNLVYDLASSILNSSFLDGAHQGRYMCIPSTDEPSEEQAKYLRALWFGGKISREMCSNITRLRILFLDGDEIEELPNEIRKLISLRFLDIHSTGIKYLPPWIGELYLLETLIAPKCLEKLPDTLRFSKSLRYLHIPNINVPPDIRRQTSLQIKRVVN